VRNDKQDRDAIVDRLLHGAMARELAGSGSECLDADTLAAWADNALDARELAAAQIHAADCARCQATLAAMVKTSPATPDAAGLHWGFSLRWLIPLTAAAAAVIVWIVVPLREDSVNVRQVGQSAESISAPAALPPPAAPTTSPSNAVEPPPARTARGRESRERDTFAKQNDLAGEKQKKDVAADRKDPASSDAPAVSEGLARRADARLEKATAANETAASAPAAPAPIASAFSVAAPEIIVVSPDPATRWRLMPRGAVQRSTDGGATWQAQNTGVSETLAAGTSPSPLVCWVVGPRGIVLLSTDGRTWTRTAFPEAVQLVAVRATDAQTATVTTADGRAFATDDGGATWTRTP
jgi:hypothetical protein